MQKVFADANAAIFDVEDGATIMVGGFGLCGIPENLIMALLKKNARNLTTISNNVGVDGFGMGFLLANGQIAHHIGTYVGENKLLEEKVLKKEISLELIPQGTFSERIRAGGAGIPAFYTPTGVDTMAADGKEMREFEGKPYLMEAWLRADFAFVKAWKGDKWGNLVYRKTARNFNPMMATAAAVTIAEVEHLVEVGEIDPDEVHTPGIFVKRLFQTSEQEKRIERLRTRARASGLL
ncbi:MAG TPA: CoA transferase subunit A [Terriglobales bacterium]|nr:CoA transferase subunit A [Terriglobales bacterium]